MLVNTTPQTAAPVVSVDSGATAVRGFSTPVRSDIPPVQQGDGVKYFQGRPSDEDTYAGLYSGKKRSESVNSETKSTIDPAQPEEQGGKQRIEEKDASGSGGQQGKDRKNNQSQASTQVDLSPEDQAIIDQLKRRDREVRLHERAHQAAGGQITGSASYEYKRGPDGKNYAVGGEVSVDTGNAADPRETLDKARQIKSAALAPAQPFAQDRRVAAKAERMMAEARQELRLEALEQSDARVQQADVARRKREEELKLRAEEEKKSLEEAPAAQERAAVAPSAKTSEDDKSAASDDLEKDDNQGSQEEKATARSRLEKILLQRGSPAQQAAALGYISPDKPKGDSGLFDLVV